MRNFPPELFLKAVLVLEDATVKFTHLKKKFHLTSPCFTKPDDLRGKTVLIDAGASVFRGEKKIGNATPVKPSK